MSLNPEILEDVLTVLLEEGNHQVIEPLVLKHLILFKKLKEMFARVKQIEIGYYYFILKIGGKDIRIPYECALFCIARKFCKNVEKIAVQEMPEKEYEHRVLSMLQLQSVTSMKLLLVNKEAEIQKLASYRPQINQVVFVGSQSIKLAEHLPHCQSLILDRWGNMDGHGKTFPQIHLIDKRLEVVRLRGSKRGKIADNHLNLFLQQGFNFDRYDFKHYGDVIDKIKDEFIDALPLDHDYAMAITEEDITFAMEEDFVVEDVPMEE